MPIFYCIKPKNNGYVIISQNSQGEHIEVRKEEEASFKTPLIFNTEKEAQDYIDNNLDTTKYSVEWAWRSDDYVCPSCGSPLQVRCVVGADESCSGFTEQLCSCRNTNCLLDWNVIIDQDKVIKIERYFFG